MEIRFAIAGRAGRIDTSHPLWSEPLPIPVRRKVTDQRLVSTVAHGAYFQAIHTYFHNEGAQHLHAALGQLNAAAPSSPLPGLIEVILEKHGEFYHPARVLVETADTARSLVLNVALTPVGFEWMRNEILALQEVATRLPPSTIPHVYGNGRVEGENGQCFQMFLADWFDDYHEFHLSIDPRDGQQKIIVWDNRQKPFFLAPTLRRELYYQTAYLLTRAYDPRSTRQIYPWHHASGDFVLKVSGDAVNLKLISVRQFAPTLTPEPGQDLDDESRLMAALAFFANLTIRNRIDRLDGTGDLAWADDEAVTPTVAGFRQGMIDSQVDSLGSVLNQYSSQDWIELLGAVGTQYQLMPAEEDLMARFITAHAAYLPEAIDQVYF